MIIYKNKIEADNKKLSELEQLFRKSKIKNSVPEKLSNRVLIANRYLNGEIKNYCVTVFSCKRSEYQKEKETLKNYWFLSYEQMKEKLTNF